MKAYVVTGVPPGAQAAAAERGRISAIRRIAEGRGKKNPAPQKGVRGQVGQIVCDRKAADEYVHQLLAQGYIVTLRRWKLPW